MRAGGRPPSVERASRICRSATCGSSRGEAKVEARCVKYGCKLGSSDNDCNRLQTSVAFCVRQLNLRGQWVKLRYALYEIKTEAE